MISLSPQVFIVDDDESVCKSMAWLFESVGLKAMPFTNPAQFLDTVTPLTRGAIVMDIRMPQMSGLEVQAKLKEKNILIPIVFLTSHHDIQVAVKAMKAGAVDFITKPFNEQELLDTVHRALALGEHQKTDAENIMTIKARVDNLSNRERQVLELVTSGMLNKNISHELGICPKTVELHRSRVMKKMHARTLAELVKMHILYRQSQGEKITM